MGGEEADSSCTPLCPTRPKDLDGLLGVDELSMLSLRESRLDLGGKRRGGYCLGLPFRREKGHLCPWEHA